MGDQFSVQLDQLDDLANKRLPGIGHCLSEVLSNLNRAIDESYGAFVAAGASAQLFEETKNEWDPTADFLQQVLQDNVENLDLASKALKEIAHRYRQADGQA
ncbi:hypothetical protein Lesp02_33320 [Lentzea sp. NBRC 105346]|uniref:WXG100 family type VII secretion target n=1 Tax=Lentzea sp. NBRC 105346 TaxID=3032205 RepID=UPI0024A4F608|nr:WXG100 family type VII secretion target [Lentzea sp. NBRC 105346]GLZ31144.1 hypothetical protein Lesp02_33320 [Lentzea sp. NBRC 105346]